MATTPDVTSHGLVARSPEAAQIVVEHDHAYQTEHGPLPFDLYRPPHAPGPLPAVVLVTGLPDPGAAAYFGKPLKDWASYGDWARSLALAGLVAITYVNREPADVQALLRQLRADAGPLGIDPERLGLWSCSGNVPNALALLARERLACAAFLYGFFLDLDGATHVADAAKQFFFATPPISLDELPRELPMLVVRAGKDATPGLEASLQRFLAAARARGLALTLLDHAEAPHAFDLVDDSPRTREVIDEVLAFLRRSLGC